MPPTIACRFTAGELSALSVVAAQVAKHGRCDLALDHIAALAGVGRTTVRNALGEARRLGFLTVEVRQLRAFRNDTNVIRIVRVGLAIMDLDAVGRRQGRGWAQNPALHEIPIFLTRVERAGFNPFNRKHGDGPGEKCQLPA